MTEQYSRFRGLTPPSSVDIPPLSEFQRFARRLLSEELHGQPISDDFARPESSSQHTKPRRLTRSQRKEQKEREEMEKTGFIKRGTMWYRPGKKHQSESA